jgi:hypothetical protein
VKDGKWKKASVPSSYVLEEPAADAKPKRPGRKPKEPIPQTEPVAEVVEAKATHQEYAPAPAEAPAPKKAKAAMTKPGRKPAMAKAKASQKTARPKRSELELVALLRKADIQI